jgi:hypothetical protein
VLVGVSLFDPLTLAAAALGFGLVTGDYAVRIV